MPARPDPVPDLDWSPERARELGDEVVALWTEFPELQGDDEAIDRLNERIMTAIHADGRTYCSDAVLRGRFALRACIVNFRTEAEDIELLLEVAEEHGRALVA